MLRRFFSVGLLNALLLCGWGGVFAAVVCPHAASAATHPCCLARLKRKESEPTSAHCHTQTEASGDAHEAAQDSHDGARLHDAEAHDAESHGAEQVSQTSHDAGHASKPSHGTAHAARDERAGGGLVLEGARAAWAVRSSEGCAHCVSRPEQRNAPAKARSGEGARREQSRPAPSVQTPHNFSPVSFAPAVIPVQGSPPTPSRLHVLLGVFLI